MAERHLRVPLEEEQIRRLRIGDLVTFSGRAWTCRSRLQRRVFDEGHPLPFSTEDRNLLIHAGPIVVREAPGWRLVSLTPTSSLRFEKWGPRSVREWKLRAIVGKTTMGPDTMRAMRDWGCIHATPLGVTPQRFADALRVDGVYGFEELGSTEAAWQLSLHRFGPFLVDIDTEGNNRFDRMDPEIEAGRGRAYARLGIPPEFRYTKLY